MRLFKPPKGFRSWNTLGVLWFSATLFSGVFFQEGGAYAQEHPIRPPLVTRLASKPSEVEASSVKDDKLERLTEKLKATPVKPVAFSIPNKLEKPVEEEEAFGLIEEGGEPNNFSNGLSAATIKEKDEAKETPKALVPASSKIVDESLSKNPISNSQKSVNVGMESEAKKLSEPASNVVADKVAVKTESKAAEHYINKTEAKKEPKPVTEIKPKKSLRTEKPFEAKKVVKKTGSKVSKKTEDEVNMQEGWDWFSAPLVFKEDANGKRVLVADKNAPKIVISKANTSSHRPYEIPLAVVPMAAEEYESSEPAIGNVELVPSVVQVKSKDEYIKPVETESCLENIPTESRVASDSKKGEPSFSLKPLKNGENKLFVRALNKMAKLKKLRSSDKEFGKFLISSHRSPSMIRLREFVESLIIKEIDVKNSSGEAFLPNAAPQAPPTHVEAEEYKSESVAQQTDGSAVESAPRGSRSMTFIPYVGRFTSNRRYYFRF